MTSSKENIRNGKTGSRLVPCSAVEDKYIDALMKKNSPSLSLDLALILLITRFEKVPALAELSILLHREETEIECSLITLFDIGFLTLS